jgi:hypothetical protein
MYDVIPIVVNYGFLKTQYLRLVHRITGGAFHRSYVTAIFDRVKLKKKIKRALAEECNVFLAIAASELLSAWKIPKGVKVIYLSDATYRQMLNYYFHNVSKHDVNICDNWEQNAINRADIIIYSNDWAKRGAVEYYHCPLSKINVIPFSPNMEIAYHDIKGSAENIVNLLFVGVDWKRKGMDIVLATMEILNKRETKKIYFLTVVGFDEPDNLKMQNVEFMGRLNKDNPSEMNELIACYEKADLFFLPTYAECSGIVFSEAAMYGLPVVTHDTGGLSTYVKDGYNGKTLPLGSTAEEFANTIIDISDNKTLQEYSANAREYYEERLNKERWLKDFEKIVNEQNEFI